DRTSVGFKPMCATVCPSEAIFFGPKSVIEAQRKNKANNQFIFGGQEITTKVYIMMDTSEGSIDMDVMDFISTNIEDPQPWVV
ncbi:MAG: 4Fe-4S ferredoxin, partial [Candidatus Omnitrophica bacterium]|nr:4Fe-4S ferredoxin [Candidatus Omnitrophota bacterium]